MTEVKAQLELSNKSIMFTRECSLIRKSVFILMLLSLFSVDTQLFAEQQESNEQAGFFEMSLEDSKARIKALEEENRMLKGKIAAIESTKSAEEFHQEPKAAIARKIDKKDRKGWMTAEYQFDTRGFNTINFTGGADLPLGWSIWGFTDIETAGLSLSYQPTHQPFMPFLL